MTRNRAMGVAVAAAVVLTSLAWIGLIAGVLRCARPHQCNRSDIVPPMSLVIGDLAKAADAGRHDDVKRKLHLLSERWEAYRTGGDGPSLFFEEIVAAGRPGDALHAAPEVD